MHNMQGVANLNVIYLPSSITE